MQIVCPEECVAINWVEQVKSNSTKWKDHESGEKEMQNVQNKRAARNEQRRKTTKEKQQIYKIVRPMDEKHEIKWNEML